MNLFWRSNSFKVLPGNVGARRSTISILFTLIVGRSRWVGRCKFSKTWATSCYNKLLNFSCKWQRYMYLRVFKNKQTIWNIIRACFLNHLPPTPTPTPFQVTHISLPWPKIGLILGRFIRMFWVAFSAKQLISSKCVW